MSVAPRPSQNGAISVLGPLPLFYKFLVCVAAIALFVGGGAWTALMLPAPILVSAGASVGLAIGGLCAFFLLHSFDHGTPAPAQRPGGAGSI